MAHYQKRLYEHARSYVARVCSLGPYVCLKYASVHCGWYVKCEHIDGKRRRRPGRHHASIQRAPCLSRTLTFGERFARACVALQACAYTNGASAKTSKCQHPHLECRENGKIYINTCVYASALCNISFEVSRGIHEHVVCSQLRKAAVVVYSLFSNPRHVSSQMILT